MQMEKSLYHLKYVISGIFIENLNFFSEEIRNAFNIYNCVECGSGLIMPDKLEGEAVNSDFTCKSCDEIFNKKLISICFRILLSGSYLYILQISIIFTPSN